MSEKLKEMSAAVFVGLTVSDASAPGSDSVSAPFGFLSAALAGMVAGLTVGKKKYAKVEAEVCEVAATAEALKEELAEEINRDSDSFNEFMAVMALSKNADEEKAARKVVMQDGLESVAKVPCRVAETAARISLLARTVVKRGNTNTMIDGLVAAMTARTAVIDAGLNVKINPISIEDKDFVAECSACVAAFEEQAIAAEHEIFAPSELTREI